MFEYSLNQESIGRKLVTIITGYRMAISKLKETWHIYPMEDIQESDGAIERRLVILPRDEGRDEIVERLSKAIDEGKINSHVWATPGLPMLIFITAGVIVSIFLGDIVWVVLSAILG
jgi:preflagellin peptidase FlaK